MDVDYILDISPHNVLMRIKDESILPKFAQKEIEQPSARIVRPDRTIYTSRLMPRSPGLPVLCDFGEARVGSHKHSGDIMPGIMRAPDVILGMDWDCKVDIWAIGIMVSVLLNQHLSCHLLFLRMLGVCCIASISLNLALQT